MGSERAISDSEKEKRLLHEVFPQHIAKQLKEGKKVEPQQHECVTIFFSDIVGFTDISRQLKPFQVRLTPCHSFVVPLGDKTHTHSPGAQNMPLSRPNNSVHH